MSFRKITAMLRLGKKYEIDYLADEALARLKHDYPRNLSLYKGLGDLNTQIEYTQTLAVDVLNLTFECSLSSIMPVVCFGYISQTPLVSRTCNFFYADENSLATITNLLS